MVLDEILQTQSARYCDERMIQKMLHKELEARDIVTSLCWIDNHPAIEINGIEQWVLIIYVEDGECTLNSDHGVGFISLDKNFWHRLLLEIDQ